MMEALLLPRRIAEALRRAAEAEGVCLEDLLLDWLTRGADPPQRAVEYAKAALDLLEAAKAELAAGDLRQASEKAWGAAALAVKAYAYWRDSQRLASHGELWRYAKKMAEELGDWVHDAWAQANAMHINYYEGWAQREQVEKAIERVARLVEEVARRIGVNP